ncbi:protein gar2-like, partial [Trifolium medium]|nr:protein gar2-like [Trifolium medium]
MEAFLAELQVPMTNKPMLSVITQIEAHIDHYVKDLQRFLNNEEQVKAQRLAQAILWEKANISNAKVEQMKKQSHDTVSGVNACKDNIS